MSVRSMAVNVGLVAGQILVAGVPPVDATFFQRPALTVIRDCAGRAEALRPKSNQVKARAAWLYAVAGDKDASRRCREVALPGDTQAHRWVGMALWQEGRVAEALNVLCRVPFEGDEQERSIRQCADALAERGRWQEAEALMQALEKVEPGEWDQFLAFGLTCARAGRLDTAKAWFMRATALRATLPELWADIGEAYASAAGRGGQGTVGTGPLDGSPAQVAVRCASTLAFLAPKSSYFQSRAGALWLRSGDRASAEAAFKRGEALDANDPKGLAARGRGYLAAGLKKEASEAYQALFKLPLDGLFTQRGQVLGAVAVELLEGGDLVWAQAAMTASYQCNTQDPHPSLAFARAALKAGKTELAVQAFVRAAGAAPKDETVWLDIGCALAEAVAVPMNQPPAQPK